MTATYVADAPIYIREAIATIQGAGTDFGFVIAQANAANTTAMRTALEALLAGLNLPNEVSVAVTVSSYNQATAGAIGSPAGTNGDVTFTVAVSAGEGNSAVTRSTAPITARITATAMDPAHYVTVRAAETAINNANNNANFRARAINATIAEAFVEAQIKALLERLEINVEANIVPGAFVPAENGTSSNPEGNPGSFGFSVELSRGLANLTVSGLTMVVEARPDYATAVAEATDAVEEIDFAEVINSIPNLDQTSEAALIAAIEEYIENLFEYLDLDVDFEIDVTNFTPAAPGTQQNPNGTPGTFEFTVNISAGEGTDQVTDSVDATVVLAARPWVNPADLAAVQAVAALLDNFQFSRLADDAQEAYALIVARLEQLLGYAMYEHDVDIEVTADDADFTAAVHGTNLDPEGEPGSFNFTVVLTKGNAVVEIDLEMVVSALRYNVLEEDQNAVDDAHDIITAINPDEILGEGVTNAADAKDAIIAYLISQGVDPDLIEITPGTLNPATPGTPANPNGTPGDFEFVVEIASGNASRTISLSARIPARALPTFTVTFNTGGGTRTGGGALSQPVLQGQNAVAPTLTRPGFVFTGWSRTFTNVQGSFTVIANWRAVAPATFTVTFNANGGTPAPAARVVAAGARLGTLPTAPRRSGQVFQGWFTAARGGTRVTEATVINANTQVFAQWRPTAGRIRGANRVRVRRSVRLTAQARPGQGRVQSVRWSVSGRNARIRGRNNRARVQIQGVRPGRARVTARITFSEGGRRTVRMNLRVR